MSRRRFLALLALGYAASRLASALILAIVATRQVPTGWTGPEVGYLTFTAQWDGQWYERIVEGGYPRTLPTDARGLVAQNPWAFYPLFPALVRAVQGVSGADFFLAGSTVSLGCGFAAALLMGLLLRERLGPGPAILAVLVWSAFPAAVVLQVGYSEAVAMLLVVGVLLALDRQRWLLAAALALLTGLARPVAVPLAVVTAVALWSRWRDRARRPLGRGELARAAAALAGCGLAGLLWPAIAWAATGRADAYPSTMAAWRGSHELVPVQPWFDIAYVYLHDAGRWLLLLALFVVVTGMLPPVAGRLGPHLRAWSLAYPAYLVLVLEPFTSLVRYLIPMFPYAAVAIGAARPRASGRVTRAMVVLTILVVSASLVGQWYWTDLLWRFVPPTDYPP